MIYVYESGCGVCKVGYTNRPLSRIRQLNNTNGMKCTRFDSFPVSGFSYDVESECHRRLSNLRIFGEWFSICFEDAVKLVYEIACGGRTKPKDNIDEFRRRISYDGNRITYYHKSQMAFGGVGKLNPDDDESHFEPINL